MHFSTRHHLARLLRLASLAVLMLAVLMNPVLATMGDMHEAEHGVAGHMQSVEQHGHDAPTGMQEEESDLLHALLHASHCCGHPTAILASTLVTDFASPAIIVPTHVADTAHLPAFSDHFRPPISA